jgi:hypothetical protein
MAEHKFPDIAANWSPLAALRQMADTKWLIDGVLQQDSIAMAFGAPGTFKSFMAMDMAVAVAAGQPWQDRETKRAAVIYLAAEGGNTIHLRRAAAQISRGITNEQIPLAIVQMRPRLDEQSGLITLAQLVEIAIGETGDGKTIAFLTPDFISHKEDDELRTKFRMDSTDTGDRDREGYRQAMERLEQSRMTEDQKVVCQAVDAALMALKEPTDKILDSMVGIDNVLLIVDTFAQVTSDDTKAVVSRYTQNLRDLQDRVLKAGKHITLLTIDHTTKNGGDYLGSISKEGNSDTVMMVERSGSAMSMKLTCQKQKDADDFEPIYMDMKSATIEGFQDGYGRPLQTLCITDGTRSARLRRAVGADGDTAAGRVLGMLEEAGALSLDDLKARFLSLPDNRVKKIESVKRTFRRAIDALLEDDLIEIIEPDMVRAKA